MKKVLFAVLSILLVLDVYGQLTYPGAVGSGSTFPYLQFTANGLFEGTIRASGTGYTSFGLWESGVRRWSLYNHNGNAHTLYFMNAAGNEVLTLTQTGNLALGVITPLAKLHVSGTNSVEQWIEATNDGHASLTLKSNSKKWEWSKRPSTEGDAMWLSYNAGSEWATPAITVRPDGKVGIGSSAPDAELTVKGTVHAKEVKVELGIPGPDYVFEKDYNLQSLTDLEQYLQQHKHLPEVPSAKEMEANGINLSEMNMLLLKKVEELTLHLLEQDKQIKIMQEDLKKLQQN